MTTLAQEIKAKQAKNLMKLIDYFGSQTRTAAYLDTSPQVIQGWLLRGRISAKMAIKAELVTGHYLTKEQLRPDVMAWESN